MATFRYQPCVGHATINVYHDDILVFFGHRSHCVDYIYANGEEGDTLIYPAYTTTVGEDRRESIARARWPGIDRDKKTFARNLQ